MSTSEKTAAEWTTTRTELEDRVRNFRAEHERLRSERASYVLAAECGDVASRRELDRLTAEAAGVAQRITDVETALDQARVEQQRQRDQNTEAAARVKAGEIAALVRQRLDADRRIDSLLSGLKSVIDERAAIGTQLYRSLPPGTLPQRLTHGSPLWQAVKFFKLDLERSQVAWSQCRPLAVSESKVLARFEDIDAIVSVLLGRTRLSPAATDEEAAA